MKLPCVLLVVLLWCLLCMPQARARCTLTGAAQTEDGWTAQIPFGRINLTSTYLQPVGTLLASVVVPPTNYTWNGANASTVLWKCDMADLPGLYFLVATNGDDRVGGFHDIGGPDGLQDVYATWFQYVGLRLTMAGEVVTRYWKKVPLTTYETVGDKVHIRLQDVPVLQAELFRVSNLPPVAGSPSAFCGGMGVASAGGTVYTCTQPNAYVQLHGPGLSTDNIGEDSAYRWVFWGVDNGFGYGMRNATSLSNNATCVARTATPQVVLPPISAAELSAGGATSAQFNVQLECSDAADSGVGSGQTAVGLQVSPAAYTHAQALGLVNTSGGVEALVSDNYGLPGYAGGVGIYLEEGSSGTALPFVGQPGHTGSGGIPGWPGAPAPTGRAAGWWPVTEGATAIGSGAAGYQNYQRSYTAVLKQLPEQQATPGLVRATAYVLVKVQ